MFFGEKSMNSKEIKAKIEGEGYIHTNVIFEIVGNPKDYVENAIKSYLEKLKAEENIIIVNQEVEPAEKQDALWSTFAEVELLVKNLETLTWFCMNFMPASVEIMGPETLVFKARDLTNWLNDMLSKLHEIAMLSQQVGQQNKMMLRNVNTLIRNAILICIDSGTADGDAISKKIGALKKDIDPVFEAMVKEGTIKKHKTKYLRK